MSPFLLKRGVDDACKDIHKSTSLRRLVKQSASFDVTVTVQGLVWGVQHTSI